MVDESWGGCWYKRRRAGSRKGHDRILLHDECVSHCALDADESCVRRAASRGIDDE